MNDYIEEMQGLNEEALLVDDYDDCIVGIGIAFGRDYFFVYNQNKMIEKMMDRDGMTQEEAIEFFDFNILGAYMGENMPVFMI